MSDYILTCDEETAGWIGNDVDLMKPIVRCRDCKFYDDDDAYCGGCTLLDFFVSDMADEGFCSWAERREQ